MDDAVSPLDFNITLQLAPDGTPWVRWQFSHQAMANAICFPLEHAEGVINKMTEGTRKAVKSAYTKKTDIITPDFSGIEVKRKNG
jgi:hypothetical protein